MVEGKSETYNSLPSHVDGTGAVFNHARTHAHTQAGVFSPGPRFILELRPFLQEVFGEDVAHCHLCKDPAIQVQCKLLYMIV